MLWLAILTRDTGIPASQHIGIKDEVVALDFDLAVSHRLFRLRQEERKELAKLIAYECGRAFFGGEEQDALESEYLHDKYIDANTERW